MLLSTSHKEFLTRATEKYELQMTAEALDYLAGRGISASLALTSRLGYISQPEPGHEHMAGMLAIPYITRAGVVNIKTRCIRDHDCGELSHAKYSGPHDSGQFLYNVDAFLGNGEFIAIAEGEMDTLSLAAAGIPAVGVPGVSAWQKNKHWPYCFTGYKRVYIFADNDVRESGKNPGMDLARRICDSITVPTSIITLPPNEDVNHCLVAYGAGYLRDKVGLE